MNQYYSKIAQQEIYRIRETENQYCCGVTIGDLNLMERLARLFGWDEHRDKSYVNKNGIGGLHQDRFQFVLNKLDRETKENNALSIKKYISYSGLINRPTRYFKLKEFDYNSNGN